MAAGVADLVASDIADEMTILRRAVALYPAAAPELVTFCRAEGWGDEECFSLVRAVGAEAFGGTVAALLAAFPDERGGVTSVVWRYGDDLGNEGDYRRAWAVFQVLAEGGDASAMYSIGRICETPATPLFDYDGELYSLTKGREWYAKAARAGHDRAQVRLGEMLEEGIGGVADEAGAARWYRRAAAQHSIDGQYRLGLLYEKGKGVTQNYATARALYQQAFEAEYADGEGDANAAVRIGLLYEEGKGTPQDYAKAREWYEKGWRYGMTRLASLYARGLGVAADCRKAIALYEEVLYEEGSWRGDFSANYELASLYAGEGECRDDEAAYTQMKIAASKGAAGAEERLTSLAQRLTPDRIAAATERAERWLATYYEEMEPGC